MDKKQELLNKTGKAMTMACMAAMLSNKLNTDSMGIEGKIVLEAYRRAALELSSVAVELAKEVVGMPEDVDDDKVSFEDLMKDFNKGGAEAEGET